MEINNQQQNHIKEISEMNDDPNWITEIKIDSYKKFKKLSMPDFIYGLNIKLTVDEDLESKEIEKLQKVSRLILSENLGVKIFANDQALNSYDDIIKDKIFSTVKDSKNKFVQFHNSLVNNFLLIHIPDNFEANSPIEITTTTKEGLNFDHIIVIAGNNSKASIIEKLISKDENKSYVSKIIEIFTGTNSKINYTSVQTFNHDTFYFVKKNGIANKDSEINWLDCVFGSRTTTSEVTTNLRGEGAKTDNYGVYFGDSNQQLDLVFNSIHETKNTYSNILTRGALTDQAKSIYRGLVKIEKDAFSSSGYQKQDTLLLNDEVISDSIPNLEIDNSDVKCSHGVSVGKVDLEKLFYLQSRGLSYNEATMLYIKGFFNELILKMDNEKLIDKINELIESKMKKK